MTNILVTAIYTESALSKVQILHTYLQNFKPAKNCDITYAIGSDGDSECAINLSCWVGHRGCDINIQESIIK